METTAASHPKTAAGTDRARLHPAWTTPTAHPTQLSPRLPISNASDATFDRMHPTLRRNYRGFESHDVPLDRFVSALSKDKKNLSSDFTLILPDANSVVRKEICTNDDRFRKTCADYFSEARIA